MAGSGRFERPNPCAKADPGVGRKSSILTTLLSCRYGRRVEDCGIEGTVEALSSYKFIYDHRGGPLRGDNFRMLHLL